MGLVAFPGTALSVRSSLGSQCRTSDHHRSADRLWTSGHAAQGHLNINDRRTRRCGRIRRRACCRLRSWNLGDRAGGRLRASGVSRTYFTDRDLGKRFGEILKAGGLNVERHADHFAPDTPDEVWLAEIGRRGWIALTHDRRIRYKPNERDAVMRHAVALLVIVGHASFPELAHGFVATIPRIEQFLASHRPPFIAKVYRPTPDKNTPGRA